LYSSWNLNTIQLATAADIFQHQTTTTQIIPSCVDDSMNVVHKRKLKYSDLQKSESSFLRPSDGGSMHSLEVKRFKTEKESHEVDQKEGAAKPKPPSSEYCILNIVGKGMLEICNDIIICCCFLCTLFI